VATDLPSIVDRLGRRAGVSDERRASLAVTVSALALVAAKVGTMGFGFLAWIVAARLYPANEVGLASGAVSAVTLCAQFALVGLGSAVITLLPAHIDRPSRLLDTSVSLLTLTAAIAGIAFVLFAGNVLQELRVVAADPFYALLFVALAVGGTLGVLFDQVSTARRRGDQVLLRGVAAGVGTLVAVVVIGRALGGGTSRDIFAAWVLGGLITVGLGLISMGRAVPGYGFRPRLDTGLATTLSRVGLPNYVLTLTERAPGFALPIFVTELLSPTDNAHWYAAWMMAWVVFIVPIQVGMTSFAEIAREPGLAGRIVRHGVRTSLAIGIVGAAVVAILAEPLLHLLGPGYAAAGAPALRILVVGIVPLTFVQAYFSYCRARGRLGEAIAVGLLTCLASIAAPALAASGGGLIGMAVAWLAVQVVAAIVASARLRQLAAAG
jgi:O-antigen/teichoic acid export membrane protein